MRATRREGGLVPAGTDKRKGARASSERMSGSISPSRTEPAADPEPSDREPVAPKATDPRAERWDRIERSGLVFVGLTSVVVAVIVLARPNLTVGELLILLAGAVALNSVRSLLAGGRWAIFGRGGFTLPGLGRIAYRDLGLLGIGLLSVAIALGVVFFPNTTTAVAVFLLAIALVAQGLARITEGVGRSVTGWIRGSSIATGAIVVILVVGAVAFEGFALLGFAILVGVILLVNGIDTVVVGLRPTDPRQFVLLKLILFAAFYGLVMINWIDLFGKEVPGYGVWLVLSYMAPFGVLLVFQGWEAWPLATSLGLLVSLMNDVGYFFVGNLLFGFHENLLPWIAGQLGFKGGQVVTYFEGGDFTITVTSWMMGLSIYARALVVAAILVYWWRHPTGIVARSAETPGSPPATGVDPVPRHNG